MNRKERRAAGKQGMGSAGRRDARAPSHATISIDGLAAEASRAWRAGRISEAQAICRQILAREPAHVQGLNLLGLTAQASGDHRLAVKTFAKAIAADEVNAACHYNAGNSHQALGHRGKALAHFESALALGMEDKAVGFILQSPVIAGYVARAAGPTAQLVGSESIAPLAKDLFLRAAMQATTLANVQLESLLARARAGLLRLAAGHGDDGREADAELIGFACALARQCFINEYVYDQSEEESALANTLREALLQHLASGAGITPLTLAVVAACFPLHTLPGAEALLRREWPADIAGLLQVQLREPIEEIADRGAIATLAAVRDSVSLQVMRQYEENPYPRWTINPLTAFVADEARRNTAPTAGRRAELDILIAGCGTGSHAIQIAQVYPNARLLAVDISLSSLAYARRKTRELGLHNIEYAHADILELGSIGRSFDRIESVGVLHHLAEPAAGWRVLVSLLRPDGRMRIGLYSRLARRVIAEARAHIAARGYRATAADIRSCRKDLIGEPARWKSLTAMRDFYSISGCRDLLFNVMEHTFTLPEIAAFLQEHDLSFEGFEPFDDPAVLEQFHRQFADAADEADLDQWHRFEQDHPETFWGMYIFTAGKKAQHSGR